MKVLRARPSIEGLRPWHHRNIDLNERARWLWLAGPNSAAQREEMLAGLAIVESGGETVRSRRHHPSLKVRRPLDKGKLQKIDLTRLSGVEPAAKMAAMKKFIETTKPRMLAWTPEGNVESRQSFPTIGGQKLDWKVVMEIPAKFDEDFMGLWKLWLLTEGLLPRKGRYWNWVVCSQPEWHSAFTLIIPLLEGAARDAAQVRRAGGVPPLEKLRVVDSWMATYRDMLKAAETNGSSRKVISTLKNRLLLTALKQAESNGRKRNCDTEGVECNKPKASGRGNNPKLLTKYRV